jgi:hypothetical protein
MQSSAVAIPLEELKLNKKMDATFKNLFTIHDPYTHQRLSNYRTFNTI